MKNNFLFSALALYFIILSSTVGNSQTRKKITDYCPESDEVSGWFSDFDPNLVKGDDLFLQINGGADIYLEYGFRDAVFHSYKMKNGSTINLEIYRMKSSESAYGIYTFKTGLSGKPVETGHEGWMEEYYLNFWKGDLLVTLIGLDTQKETLEGILNFAKSIDNKIGSSSVQPDILGFLPDEGLVPNGKTYLKGNLALFNQYVFDSRNIFGITEGLSGEYGTYRLFLLFYKDKSESLHWFNSAREVLKENGLFHDFREEEYALFMMDQENQAIFIKPLYHSICIVIGSNNMDFESIFDRVDTKYTK